jgi:transposase
MGGDEPMIPDAAPGGRPRRAPKREIVEAIAVSAARRLFMAAAAARFPPWQTVYHYLRHWQREGVWAKVHHTLVMADRERGSRPTKWFKFGDGHSQTSARRPVLRC